MGEKGVAQYFNFLSRKLGRAGVICADELTSQLINTVVTDARLQEKRRSLNLEIFTALASTANLDGILERILHLLRDYCQCDAAGIRLRKGEDYPYIKTSGFTAAFVSEETMLCSPVNGLSNRAERKALLECLCGRVICGDLEVYLSSAAGQGTFYTGNINELTAHLAKKKLPFTIRNYCGQTGFSSIVWIPLSFRGETVGLLQLNDSAPDKFTGEEVDFLSIVAQSIGATLARFKAERTRSKSEVILGALLEKSREGFFVASHEGNISFYNKAMEQISGYTKDQVAEHGWFYLAFPYEEERRQAVQKARLVMAGKLGCVEFVITRKDGEKNWVKFSVAPLEIDGKQYTLTMLSEVVKSELIKPGNLPILN